MSNVTTSENITLEFSTAYDPGLSSIVLKLSMAMLKDQYSSIQVFKLHLPSFSEATEAQFLHRN